MAPLRLLLLLIHLLAGYHHHHRFVVTCASLLVNDDSTDTVGGGGPGFDQEPQDLVVGRNQSGRLDCLIRQSKDGPRFAVHWFQDGLALPLPDQRRHLLANGSLLFDRVLHKRSGRAGSDEGIYSCVATSNSNGAFVSRNASVRIAALGQNFTSWPADYTADVGDVVRFECRIDSVPEAVIDWEKDGQPIPSAADTAPVASRFVVLKTGVLHIYNIQLDDAGSYRCVANNELAGRKRRSPAGHLVVTPPNPDHVRAPHIISPLAPQSDLWILPDESVTLECLASAYPPTSAKWSVNGTTVPAGPQNGYFVTSSPGDYACSVASASGSSAVDSTARVFSVRVAAAPSIIRRPKSQVLPTAKTVRFECEVSGSPTPEIQWLKNGAALPIGGRIMNHLRSDGTLSVLVVSSTVTTDFGVYQCRASNIAGSASAPALLLSNNAEGTRPEPPTNLKVLVLAPDEVVLSWDPPSNVPIEEVKAYTVHYMPLNNGTRVAGEVVEVLSSEPSRRIGKLKRNVSYVFYVRAYMHRFASDPSDELRFDPSVVGLTSSSGPPSSTTFQPRPPPKTLTPPGPTSSGFVPNVTLVALSPTELKVSWQKPSTIVGSGSFAFYRIQYRKHRAKEIDTEAVKGDVYEYTITGLYPGRKYDVRILPGNSNVASPWVTKEMPGKATTSSGLSPPAVELLVTNTSSVLVTWEDLGPSIGRRKADGVRLTYRQHGSRESGPILILPPSGSQRIQYLNPGTVYEFQLAGSADGREGPATQAIIQTLSGPGSAGGGLSREDSEYGEEEDDDDLFDAGPIRIDSQVLSSSALKLSWRPLAPDSHSAETLYYTLRYVSVPEEPWAGIGPPPSPAVGYIRSTAGHALLANLTAYTLYRLSVRSHDREGRSSLFSSPPVETRTLPDLPTAPLNPSWQSLPNGSVQLSWRPPLHPSGIINGYAVLLSTDPEANVDSWTRHESDTGLRLRVQLSGLHLNTRHYFRIQARNSVGWGSLSEPSSFILEPFTETTPVIHNDPLPETPTPSEHYLGVIIGLATGLGFALICALIVLFRSRCAAGLSSERSSGVGGVGASAVTSANGGVIMCNGNGFRHSATKSSSHVVRQLGRQGSDRDQRSSLMEMEAFVPMLPIVPVHASSHLDTKGGYPTVPGTGGRKDGSLQSNGSVHAGKMGQGLLMPPGNETGGPASDSTLLSEATETTCLSLDYTGRSRRRRRRRSSPSHDSSLHSLNSCGSSSSSQSSSRTSLREHDDNDTGIDHTDPQSNPDSGMTAVDSGAGSNIPCSISRES